MRNLLDLLSTPSTREDPVIQQLQDRISELEEENVNLHRLEETIRRTARLFNTVLAKSHEGIVLVTPDMVVLRLIHSAVGYQEHEISGQTVLSIIHPDDASCFRRAFSQLVTGQSKSAACEFRLRKNDGSWAWVSGEMTDMLDDPDVQAILVNARNITEQKEQMSAAEQLDALRACSEYAMFSKSPEGLILDWNPGAQQAFGYSAEEAVGENISVLVPLELLAEEISTREKIMFGEEVGPLRTIRIRRDARRVEIRLQLSPVWDRCGKVKAIAHVSHVVRVIE